MIVAMHQGTQATNLRVDELRHFRLRLFERGVCISTSLTLYVGNPRASYHMDTFAFIYFGKYTIAHFTVTSHT